LADLARRSSFDACQVLANARQALRRVTGQTRGQLRRAINELSTTVERTGSVLAGRGPDAFSNRIAGWKTSDRCDTDLILGALEYGIWSRDVRAGELVLLV
jgi:hypothetical protein